MPGFGLNSWTVGDRPDVLTIVEVAGRAGYQFVELRDTKIEQHLAEGGTLGALREVAEVAGIGVLSLNTLEHATLQTGDGLARTVERCRQLCSWARELGSPFLIVGPSYTSDSGAEPAMIRDRTVAALACYAAVAAEQDVRIGFEFHGYARCSINTLSGAIAILDELRDERVGLVVDAFHFYVGGSAFADLERLDPARLLILHLADVDHADRDRLGKSNRVMPGDGVLPLSRFTRAILTSGYTGPYSLELFRPEYWAMDPLVVAERGLESMRRVV